jgi:hypothetical protein
MLDIERDSPPSDSDRRLLRGVAAVLCLVLAFCCLIAAGVTSGWSTATAGAEAGKVAVASGRLAPLVIPLTLAVYVLVVLAAIRRPGRRVVARPAVPVRARLAR